MSETDSIEIASRRLSLALEALDEAAERHLEAGRGGGALAAQIQTLDTDRARLASELDHATARSRGLEAANREVVQRIDQAIETLRRVLADDD
jgi:serine phosphatase RsbU (regulator of sigma subunit)